MEQSVTMGEIRQFLDSDATVPASQVLEWMKSDDLQVQAGIVIILSECGNRINPPLAGETVFRFCLDYYRRCLLENPPDGEFTANRTVEGSTLQEWFKVLWKDKEANTGLITEMKKMAAEVYTTGDDGAKYAVETAFLEHLFEDPEIASYFSDWEEDANLKPAYERATEWGVAQQASHRENG